jgi:phage shock protein A
MCWSSRRLLYLDRDERLLLMQDVEALYAQAVAAQEKLQRQRQHLNNQSSAAQTLLSQRQQQEAALDSRIEELRVQRGELERTLAACHHRLQAALVNVRDQVWSSTMRGYIFLYFRSWFYVRRRTTRDGSRT